MLSSPAWPTGSSTRSSYSSSCELDASKLTVDCNFLELLAGDLTISESIFMSKAMTAGRPFADLAAPDSGASASFQRSLLPYRAGHQQQPPSMSTTLLPSFVEEEAGLYVEDLDSDGRLGIKNRYLNSSNVPSTAMVPHLTITRQQSVATAATSDSGRCSSVFSHNTHSPTFPALSYSSNREGSSHGTWYEDDPDSPQDGPASSVFTARTSLSDTHQPVLDPGNYGDMIEPSKPTVDRTGPAQATAEVHFPGSCRGTRSRPHTPPNQPHLEKARIVEISPVARGPKRTSSLEWDRYRTEPLSVTSQSRGVAVPARVTEELGQGGGIPKEDIQFTVPIIETANGRIVIDASAPPPIAFASRDQARHRLHARPSSSMAIRENEILDDGDEPSARAYQKALTGKPSLPDLRRWVEASAETLASPQRSTPYTSSAHGIPLPPEVIESLRVSISCFPETMLLTSSLSIETMRAYSKKVKHRADLDRHLGNPESDSIYSRASHSLRPSKRWNMSWLGQSRRSSSSKHHLQPTHTYSLPGTTQPPSLGMSNLSLAAPTPPAPAWAALRNIFPSAPDHLCDALYAHLLAHNYLTSLFPTPIPTITSTSTSTITSTLTPTPAFKPNPKPTPSPSPSQDPATARKDLTIPHKAASLLGMNDPVSAAAAAAALRAAPPPPSSSSLSMSLSSLSLSSSASSSRRRVLSRAGRRDRNALSELFVPTASGGGGGGGGSGFGSGLVRSMTNNSRARSGTGGSSSGFSRGGTGYGAHGAGGGGVCQEGGSGPAAVAGEVLLAGLGRCVNLLVAAMRREGEVALGDGEGSLFGGEMGHGGCAEGAEVQVVEPVLMKALCQVVRCAEEGCLGV